MQAKISGGAAFFVPGNIAANRNRLPQVTGIYIELSSVPMAAWRSSGAMLVSGDDNAN